MHLQELDLSKTLTDNQVYESIMKNYSNLGKDWILHQWNWVNNVYWAFNDHYKYMIVILLIEKTLQFYDQVNVSYTYEEYYSKSYIEIEKFSISDLCERLKLPKETVRRKVLELEKEGVIYRKNKKILIDRKAFVFVKPENQIKFTSKYIFLVSQRLNKDKVYSKKLDPIIIENIIRKNFTLCWRWFYRMQIPLIIGYTNLMKDLTTFHIWGTVAMNQVLNVSNKLNAFDNKPPLDHLSTNSTIIENLGSDVGISAMSISDMTQIPRATIIRKCKFLVEEDLIKINNKKQYVLSNTNFKKILPYQAEIFRFKAKFIRKVLNLLVIS